MTSGAEQHFGVDPSYTEIEVACIRFATVGQQS